MTPLPSALARLESLVSPYTGVVRSVDDVLAEPCDLDLPSVCSATGHVGALVGVETTHLGSGSGATRTEARAAAIGEAVERYSACYAPRNDCVVATAAELGRAAVAPARFALFSDAQLARPGFPYARFDDRTPVAWVEAMALPGGEPAYLPAQLVYLGWRLEPGEQRICSSTSSGLACRATAEEAVACGLLEVIERDAFMLTWKARVSWPRLRWPDDARAADFERRRLAPTGLRVAAVDLSAVWDVPCVLGVARGVAAGEAPLGVGAASAPTVEAAVEKALDEAVRVRSWARALRAADPNAERLPPPQEIRHFEEHIHHYAYDGRAAAADFLDASPARRDIDSVRPLDGAAPLELIETLCRRLAAHGVGAYAVDVTAPDVRDAGLAVTKTVAPELCALDVEHAAPFNGGTRLSTALVRLGLRATPLAEAEINPDPHPFP